MSQEQIGSWAQTVIETLGGAAIAFIGLIWRIAQRDKEVDALVAKAADDSRSQLYEQRLYIDSQDQATRQNIYSFIQREIIVKFEASLEKHEKKLDYHEAHDDKRFSELIDRITEGFKDLSERIADLRVQVAIREAQRNRDEQAKSNLGQGPSNVVP